ncbi:ribosome biogenesis protein [Moniliophthora roreri MCA 2997]|uniref:Ribosome biogenesis protein n=2 Tax=Moniliophthora roreri TaxID=221103 RepID=V2XSC5_MONRO|nr:ribosome biogenesis protein [Moniliophthora roreri MCA 2997]KAI3616255.1 ribosome biogenesis protein [Moniliophthora roreri]
MPLDGHSYLVSQGWSGKGTGLRKGAIAKPITITQKKTLAGLGKDRDEAFPFWDHLFSAASKSIQVKISNDDSDNSDTDTLAENSVPTLNRTTTGILSNRRPVDVTPATTSGTSTPDFLDAPRLSLIALAKREAAKRNLYSRFYRGPILGPDREPSEQDQPPTPLQSPSTMATSSPDTPLEEAEKKKKRKADDLEKEERRERKRAKKEAKETEKEKRSKKAEKKKKSGTEGVPSKEDCNTMNKEERRKRKQERREAKLKRKADRERGGEEREEEAAKSKIAEDKIGMGESSSRKRTKKTKAKDPTAEQPTFPKAKKERTED